MAASSTPHADPFGSVIDGVRELCARVSEQPTWSITDDALPDLIQATDAAASAVAEMSRRLVAEAHSRNIARTAAPHGVSFADVCRLPLDGRS